MWNGSEINIHYLFLLSQVYARARLFLGNFFFRFLNFRCLFFEQFVLLSRVLFFLRFSMLGSKSRIENPSRYFYVRAFVGLFKASMVRYLRLPGDPGGSSYIIKPNVQDTCLRFYDCDKSERRVSRIMNGPLCFLLIFWIGCVVCCLSCHILCSRAVTTLVCVFRNFTCFFF